MKIDNKKAKGIILSALLLMCFMTPGLVRAQDGPINAGIAVMLPGSVKILCCQLRYLAGYYANSGVFIRDWGI